MTLNGLTKLCGKTEAWHGIIAGKGSQPKKYILSGHVREGRGKPLVR